MVSWLAGCGVVAIVALYTMWAKLVFAPVGLSLPLAWPCLSLAAMMVGFQAATWGLASFPWIRVAVLIPCCILPAAVCMLPYVETFDWQGKRVFIISAVAAWTVLAYAAACFGVQAERRGGWRAWDWLRPWLRRLRDVLPRRRRPFTSAARAQLWCEWKRRGWLMSLFLGLSIATSVWVFPILAMLDTMGGPPLAPFAFAFVYPVFTASTIGLGLAKSDFWSGQTALHSFHARQPMSDGDFVVVKLRLAAAVLAAGWLVAVPLSFAMVALPGWQELWMVDNLIARFRDWLPAGAMMTWFWIGLALIALNAAIWQSTTQALCLGLTGRTRVVTRNCFLGASAFIVVLGFGNWLYRNPARLDSWSPIVFGVALTLVLWKLGAVLRAFRALLGLQPTKTILKLLGFWLATAGSLGLFIGLLWVYAPLPKPLLALALAWLWPGGELAQCTMNLASHRHR
jgi:hypothetical protein